MRLRAHRVPEENEHVKVTRSDQRADLLVTAEWPALEAGDGQVQAVTQHLAGRAGRIQDVTGENVTVVLDPLEEVTFPVVVRDQGDVLRSGRGHDSTMGGECCRPGTGALSIRVHSVRPGHYGRRARAGPPPSAGGKQRLARPVRGSDQSRDTGGVRLRP